MKTTTIPAAVLILLAVAMPASAADIVLTPPTGAGVVVTDAPGATTRMRIGADGAVTLPGLAPVPVPATGLCLEIATGRIGTCATGCSAGDVLSCYTGPAGTGRFSSVVLAGTEESRCGEARVDSCVE